MFLSQNLPASKQYYLGGKQTALGCYNWHYK